jgi:hypothetical protein
MPTYFDIEVSLSTVYPLIWRRFLLRTTGTTFADLHRAIQDACGWWDHHLYRFDEATPRGLVGLARSPDTIADLCDAPRLRGSPPPPPGTPRATSRSRCVGRSAVLATRLGPSSTTVLAR